MPKTSAEPVVSAATRAPISTECSAARSARTRSRAPMAWAITAVMPVPRPKVTPIARNTSGMLKARAVSASGLTRPTKNMSTIM